MSWLICWAFTSFQFHGQRSATRFGAYRRQILNSIRFTFVSWCKSRQARCKCLHWQHQAWPKRSWRLAACRQIFHSIYLTAEFLICWRDCLSAADWSLVSSSSLNRALYRANSSKSSARFVLPNPNFTRWVWYSKLGRLSHFFQCLSELPVDASGFGLLSSFLNRFETTLQHQPECPTQSHHDAWPTLRDTSLWPCAIYLMILCQKPGCVFPGAHLSSVRIGWLTFPCHVRVRSTRWFLATGSWLIHTWHLLILSARTQGHAHFSIVSKILDPVPMTWPRS